MAASTIRVSQARETRQVGPGSKMETIQSRKVPGMHDTSDLAMYTTVYVCIVPIRLGHVISHHSTWPRFAEPT